MALRDSGSSPAAQGQGFDALHDPALRDFLLAAGDWELRWPPGHGFGPAWVLAGLWHLQLWHPRVGASVLVPHQSRWMNHHDIFLPGAGRRITRSSAALHALLDANTLALPDLERVHRVAALAYGRAVEALSAGATAAMRCPVHRARIPSC